MIARLISEFFGTAFLLIAVVGSGIMAADLSGGNDGLALLANAIATGAALYVLITLFGPLSGAHFNPAVSLAFALRGDLSWRALGPYVGVQVAGGLVGVWLSHLMFELNIFQISQTDRFGLGQGVSEAIATAGLLGTIILGLAARPSAVPALVAAYITGAYWFTASTSFANPAVTIARSFSDTFAGIVPIHGLLFILVQLLVALVLVSPLTWLARQMTSQT